MKFTILYNNEAKEGYMSDWGFSCLIEGAGKNILFDTGAKSKGLLFNIDKLGINPDTIDCVVISHRHFDHAGGLEGLLENISGTGPEIIQPGKKEAFEICNGVRSTGTLSSGFFRPDEQSLLVETSQGLVVLVGCSHPGVDTILKTARTLNSLESNEGIYAIIGGFHGFHKLEELEGIEYIGACHCTRHMKDIEKKFPRNFHHIHAGDIIEI